MEALYFGQTKFSIGALMVSPGAMKALTLFEFNSALERHGSEDVLLSVFSTDRGVKFWVSTKPDRSITRILLPQEDGTDW
jgi:hypothetical protein